MSTSYAPSAQAQSACLPVVVPVKGEHDCSTVEDLTRSFASACTHGDAGVIVDLSEVSFMDSSTVHLLQQTRDYLAKSGRTLALRAPSPQASRTLRHIEAIHPLGFVIDCGSSVSEAMRASAPDCERPLSNVE